MIVLWVVSTLLWWAFAFMPLPSQPPEWVTAARYACFGSMERGLPAANGWMLLVLAPASFLAGIFVIWGPDLRGSMLHVARTRSGRCMVIALALAVATEGAWVVRKVHAARAVTTWAHGVQGDTELPEAYPRQTGAAPDFTLIDQHGRAISLSSFKGTPLVLTFVFAHCQTMCPLIVGTLKRASPDRAPVLMVTLDPWRDTPSTLPGIARQWALPARFHVLSSPRVSEVLRVVDAYGVRAERNERSGDIVHPGLVLLIDARGRLIYTFNNPSPAWVREGLDRLDRTHADAG